MSQVRLALKLSSLPLSALLGASAYPVSGEKTNQANMKKNVNQKNGQFAVHEPQRLKRIIRDCFGCGDSFTTYQKDNYDYCRFCAINGNRYVSQENQCSECGNGKGIIKFPNQPPRACKLCALTKQKINCFYQCAFTAYQWKVMENHYRQKHYPNGREVKRA